MTLKEQNAIKRVAYKEAMHYMKEAKVLMKKAPKDDGYDDFIKHKRDLNKICKTAYSGMSVALDAYLRLANAASISKRDRSNVYYMKDFLRKMDIDISTDLYSAHNLLLWMCCDYGMTGTRVVEMGFENVMNIINKIKPRQGAI
jgi:hypothetical protein